MSRVNPQGQWEGLCCIRRVGEALISAGRCNRLVCGLAGKYSLLFRDKKGCSHGNPTWDTCRTSIQLKTIIRDRSSRW